MIIIHHSLSKWRVYCENVIHLLLMFDNSVCFWQLLVWWMGGKEWKSYTASTRLPRMVAIEVHWCQRWTWGEGGRGGCAQYRSTLGRSHLCLFTPLEGGITLFHSTSRDSGWCGGNLGENPHPPSWPAAAWCPAPPTLSLLAHEHGGRLQCPPECGCHWGAERC